ncbi:hypothetical protein M440DRAFT_122020 [Trichoderma longibrachiatum ATCC 18648]|uniref:Uncharacterized protein n=1 Tax=Trichoderma longibrachiatum ATCC 18648 TaxID=983965 RepID=A0A2T4BWZ9_TRILO|nr:hypothetical protein M440DRAFT_122020 [Trichoderma longibrachiatum ATCC 18648]
MTRHLYASYSKNRVSSAQPPTNPSPRPVLARPLGITILGLVLILVLADRTVETTQTLRRSSHNSPSRSRSATQVAAWTRILLLIALRNAMVGKGNRGPSPLSIWWPET